MSICWVGESGENDDRKRVGIKRVLSTQSIILAMVVESRDKARIKQRQS